MKNRSQDFRRAALWASVCTLLTLLCLIFTLTACGPEPESPSDTGTASDTAALSEPLSETPDTQPADPATDAPDTQPVTPDTQPDTPDTQTEETAPAFPVDFIVDVETGRDVRVLQLTDTQIIDAAQRRYDTRLNPIEQTAWATERMEQDYKAYLRDVIGQTKPDFIFITGDVVYGEFDDNGTVLQDFIAFMESFGIPWSPVFGNHDNESNMGADWQCAQLEAAEHCLFLQRTLTGNGNYTVGITQGGKLVRVFFLLDSNGCGNMSAASKKNKHSTTSIGFGSDQMTWVTETADTIRAAAPDARLSFAFHIQPAEFAAAFSKYGFRNSGTEANPVSIDDAADRADTDFGYLGRDLKSPWSKPKMWQALLDTGADSFFVGHEHCNCGSVVVDGVRYQYGMKSSTYDRLNYRLSDGSIAGGSEIMGTPLVGGTIMTLAEGTGVITDAHIVYAKTEEIKPEPLPDGAYTYLLDFNGSDFDIRVTTDALNREVNAAPVDGTPDGAEGVVCAANETYLVCIGVRFTEDIPLEALASLRVRMRATETSAHSKDPLFRLYNDRSNTILTSDAYKSVGGVFGEWSEIELTRLIEKAGLVKNGIVQPFTIVYRCYDAQTLVEFDSLILETTVPIPGLSALADDKAA